jgi:hypothetical protein
MMKTIRFPKYTYGIEVECVGRGASRATVKEALIAAGLPARFDSYNDGAEYDDRTWIIGTDGSVTGTNAMEIKSPILKGIEGFRTIRTFSKTLLGLDVDRKPTVNRSCGLHVHIGIANAERKFLADEVLMIMERYSSLKPEIDRLLARSRRSGEDSDYCTDFDSSIENVRDLIERMPGTQRRQPMGQGNLDQLANCAEHYDAVSIQSLDKYGTIEFRQHQGTLSGEKITNWIRFLLTHVDVSRYLVSKGIEARDEEIVSTLTAPGVRRASAPSRTRRAPAPLPFGRPEKHELFDGQPKRIKEFFMKRREEFAAARNRG